MKRKQAETRVIKTEKEQSAKKINKTTSAGLNLKSVCTISDHNELNSTFCLQAVDEFVLMRSKAEVEILKFERSLGNHLSKFQLSSTKRKCSTYNVTEGMRVSHSRVFSGSNHQQKNDSLLDPAIFPHCAQPNYQVAKAAISPYTTGDRVLPCILASLSVQGSLELSRYERNGDSLETSFKQFAEVCEIRKTSFSLETYYKYEKLKEIIEELTFSTFEWCPEIFGSTRFLAAVTKSNEVIIYSVNNEFEVAVEKSKQFDDAVSAVQWMIEDHKKILFVANSKGNLTSLSMKLFENDSVVSLEKFQDIHGKLNIPTSTMQVESHGENVLIICTKSHSIETFLVNSNGVKSLTQYIGISITGITKVSKTKSQYLIATLNNKIFLIQPSIVNNDIRIDRFEQVENSQNFDNKETKYGAYGIASSKNNALVFVALYPRTMFDHLVLKQPTSLSINILSENDPYATLINNESLKLTDYYDCIEAIRFIGITKQTTLQTLENMRFEVSLSQKFLYYLKLQLIAASSKAMYYETRSDALFGSMSQSISCMRTTIEVLRAYLFINDLITKKAKLSEISQLSIRSLSNFMRIYLTEENLTEPFKTFQTTLKPSLEAFLKKCKIASTIKPENCSYCDSPIDINNLTCNQNHKTNRCVLTKLQIPISVVISCSNCHCSTVDLETLRQITDKEDHILCPYCDRRFPFSR